MIRRRYCKYLSLGSEDIQSEYLPKYFVGQIPHVERDHDPKELLSKGFPLARGSHRLQQTAGCEQVSQHALAPACPGDRELPCLVHSFGVEGRKWLFSTSISSSVCSASPQ
jgi:hypothetical protein